MSVSEAKRLGLSQTAVEILMNIPYDEYVTSRNISKKTGMTARQIGAVISSRLLYRHVERIPAESKGEGWKYKRTA